MELEEIEQWAEKHVPDHNQRTAFVVTIKYIYRYSDSTIKNVDAFWKWYVSEWRTLNEIIQQSGPTMRPAKLFHIEMSDFLTMNAIVRRYIKPMFGIAADFSDFVIESGARFYATWIFEITGDRVYMKDYADFLYRDMSEAYGKG